MACSSRARSRPRNISRARALITCDRSLDVDGGKAHRSGRRSRASSGSTADRTHQRHAPASLVLTWAMLEARRLRVHGDGARTLPEDYAGCTVLALRADQAIDCAIPRTSSTRHGPPQEAEALLRAQSRLTPSAGNVGRAASTSESCQGMLYRIVARWPRSRIRLIAVSYRHRCMTGRLWSAARHHCAAASTPPGA